MVLGKLSVPGRPTIRITVVRIICLFFIYFFFYYFVLKPANHDYLLTNLERDIMGKILCAGKAMGTLSETPRQLEVT